MKVETRLFDQTALMHISGIFEDAKWNEFEAELLEFIKKTPNVLIHLESDLNEASFNLVKTTKKKLPNNAKVYFVSAKVQLDEKTVIDGLKLFRHPAAKRIIEIFRLEKELKTVQLHVQGAQAVLTSQIQDLLKLPLSNEVFNNAEVALHIFNIKKEADRLRTLNQIFVKETHAIKQKKPKNSGALLGDEITKQSLLEATQKALKALKDKGIAV